jgi:hypothetical protein
MGFRRFHQRQGQARAALAGRDIDAANLPIRRAWQRMHGGHANQRVKGSHKLRHIRHRDAPCRDPANAAANRQCPQDFW